MLRWRCRGQYGAKRTTRPVSVTGPGSGLEGPGGGVCQLTTRKSACFLFTLPLTSITSVLTSPGQKESRAKRPRSALSWEIKYSEMELQISNSVHHLQFERKHEPPLNSENRVRVQSLLLEDWTLYPCDTFRLAHLTPYLPEGPPP